MPSEPALRCSSFTCHPGAVVVTGCHGVLAWCVIPGHLLHEVYAWILVAFRCPWVPRACSGLLVLTQLTHPWCEGMALGSEMCSTVKLQSLLLIKCNSKLCVGEDQALSKHLYRKLKWYSKWKLISEVSFCFLFSLCCSGIKTSVLWFPLISFSLCTFQIFHWWKKQ